MTKNNLRERLRVDDVDQSELELLLLEVFTGGVQPSDREMHYGQDPDHPSLILKFTKAGKIAEVLPGPTLATEEINALAAKVASDLLQKGNLLVDRKPLFAGLPVEGFFRFEERFQILPMPSAAPRPPFILGGHPMLLEVPFLSSSSHSVASQRRVKAVREIELLCSALLEPDIIGEPRWTQSHWVFDDPAPNLVSSFRQGGYTWPRTNYPEAEFSDVSSFTPLASIDAQTYYTANSISVDDKLQIPSTLNQSLKTYFALPADDQNRFLAACYWYQQGQQFWNTSHSAAFVALVSGIEALLRRVEQTNCKHCGMRTGPGPTKLFIEFIERYVPDAAATRATRSALYQVRSAITHGDKLLHSDRALWGMSVASNNDSNHLRQLFSTVKISLVNWLLAHSN